jgi:hypothetical protein
MPLQKKPAALPRLPKLKRPSRSKAAIAERKVPLEWYYLSFATDSEFLGAAIVEAHGEVTATERATKLGINPGGEVLCWPVGKRHLHKVPPDLRNKLLTEAEVLGRLHG